MVFISVQFPLAFLCAVAKRDATHFSQRHAAYVSSVQMQRDKSEQVHACIALLEPHLQQFGRGNIQLFLPLDNFEAHRMLMERHAIALNISREFVFVL